MIPRLSKQHLERIAEQVGWFRLTEGEAEEFVILADAVLEFLDEFEGGTGGDDGAGSGGVVGPEQVDRRDPGRPPLAGEDPYNAIIRWCDVAGERQDGPLQGVRFGLKDTIAVAGVPLTLGSTVLGNFTPTVDSVVTERLLAAGARVVAMTNMDSFAISGSGTTSATGAVRNPFDPSRSAGGSSGGSAAALAYVDKVDATIGGDQGGSIRIPAAWCGILGLKPSHGLVPYTGIVGMDPTFDHVGPMARSAEDLARVLAVIAGRHDSDPRQARTPEWDGEAFLARVANATDLTGARIAMVTEGFADGSDLYRATSSAVRAAADRMAIAGADVIELSVPGHLEGGSIAFAGIMEGMWGLLQSGANGRHWQGRYWPEIARALADALRTNGGDLPPPVKLVAMLGWYLQDRYGGAIYATAQNKRGRLADAYDEALKDVDVLVMPTVPHPAFEHDVTLGLADSVFRGWGLGANTMQSDLSGHPALTMPAASVDGLPVGVMMIGRRWDDARLVEIAAAYERVIGWDHVAVQRLSVGASWDAQGHAEVPVN